MVTAGHQPHDIINYTDLKRHNGNKSLLGQWDHFRVLVLQTRFRVRRKPLNSDPRQESLHVTVMKGHQGRCECVQGDPPGPDCMCIYYFADKGGEHSFPPGFIIFSFKLLLVMLMNCKFP